MKVLFLSITTGFGHHMSAQATMDYLRTKGAECKMIDALEDVNPLLSQTVSRGFLLSTQYASKVYSGVYRWTELKEEPSPKISASRMTHTILSKRLEKSIEEADADVIVCTHVFAAQMLTQLLRSNKSDIKAKTIGIITDFTIHPYWEDTTLDYYLLASELLSNQFVKKHLPADKILPFGIPIHEKFSVRRDKALAREELGLENKRTVLLMSGSMGFGNVTKTIKRLDELDLDFQMIAVCGNNKRLKRHVEKLETRKKLLTFGFTSEVDLLMDAADCIVTKPGGLTTSEALAKGLVIVMSSNIPGQEERNMEFLLNNGLAIRSTRTFPIEECIYHLFGNPARLEVAERLTGAIAKPNAARDFGEFILGLK